MNVYICFIIIPTVSSYRFIPEEDQHGYSYAEQSTSIKGVAKAEAIPFHVLVVYGNFYCSGTLVRSMIVVTAASCFTRRIDNQRIIVKAGSNSITEHGYATRAIELKIHEYYTRLSPLNNDIALLVLEKNVHFGPNVMKVVLIEPEISLRYGTVILVSGWGQSNLDPTHANNLLWTEMNVVYNYQCSEYSHLLTSSNFCAKFSPDRRLYDNGGPATYRRLLVGILSFGGINKNDTNYAIFTNVSYFHRWIVLNSQRLLEKYCVRTELDYYSDSDTA